MSTGEKQIVFRGAHLLKNIGELDGAIVMIDEPEISMHPKWIDKILKYYKDLFNDDNGNQKTQMLFATHSETVIKEVLKNIDTLIYILNEDNRVIAATSVVQQNLKLPTRTSGEVIYKAFDVPNIDYHIALFDYVHNNVVPIKQDGTIMTIAEVDVRFSQQMGNYGIEAGRTNPRNENSLSAYIRNEIHHPGNRSNDCLSSESLRKSIQFLETLC